MVLLSHFLLLLFGVGAAFSPNFYVYMALKFCSGFCISGIIGNAFVIGNNHRFHLNCSLGLELRKWMSQVIQILVKRYSKQHRATANDILLRIKQTNSIWSSNCQLCDAKAFMMILH